MEYMDCGSLHSVLQDYKRLPEGVISTVACRVVEGLKYLQGMNIVHRDIKPSNLVINSKGEVKIADFGVSIKVVTGWSTQNRPRHIRLHEPEKWDSADGGNNGLKDFAGDVWYLRVVLLECFLGQFPFVDCGQKADWTSLTCAICFGGTVQLPETMSTEFQSFLGRCLEKDWKKRGIVSELLDHLFVNKGRCDSNQGMDVKDFAQY